MFILSMLSNIFGAFKWQVIAGLAIAFILGSAYFYWNYSQNKIADLTAKTQVLQDVVDTQHITITKLQDNFEKAQKNLTILNKQYADINKKTFVSRKAISLSKVTKENKKQTEVKINSTVNTMFRDINDQTQPETF